jgi:hypothetical protein
MENVLLLFPTPVMAFETALFKLDSLTILVQCLDAVSVLTWLPCLFWYHRRNIVHKRRTKTPNQRSSISFCLDTGA